LLVAEITIFSAKQIITMNPFNPAGTHVAVRDGKVLGVGSLEDVAGWGAYEVDETFRDKVLTPGMIEVHAHAMEGLTGIYPYQGFFDRAAPDGRILHGLQSIDALLADLKRLDGDLTDPDTPLVTVGFDPIYFPGVRLSKKELDTVSSTRPICLIHASGHVASVNTAMLKRSGITSETKIVGVVKGEDGDPNGELQEMPAMSLAESALQPFMEALGSEQCIEGFGQMARQAGVTCVGDLGGTLLVNPASLSAWKKVVNDPAFPARVTVYNLPALPGSSADWRDAARAIQELQRSHSSDKLHFPGVKFVLDGSIQGWTAMMNWPGYYTGIDQGQLLTIPEQFKEWALPFHEAGLNIHMHCNGAATIDLAIETVDQLLREVPWLDHRHTIQHAQLLTVAHLRKMKNLGMCANIFTNHLWYWGDVHYEKTVGPERANRMEPCGTAKRLGVPFSLHSDANVTPLGPLHLIWCAVNRVTPKGRILGASERISVYDALWAVTQDAAYQMHMDHLMGSIECGKWADFTVLDESPLDVDPMAIRDIPVWGTVVGGIKHPAIQHQ
jgi:predicted amidohydrolase YtcJ